MTPDLMAPEIISDVGILQKYPSERMAAGIVHRIVFGVACATGTAPAVSTPAISSGVEPGHYFEATARVYDEDDTPETAAIVQRSREDFRRGNFRSGEDVRRGPRS